MRYLLIYRHNCPLLFYTIKSSNNYNCCDGTLALLHSCQCYFCILVHVRMCCYSIFHKQNHILTNKWHQCEVQWLKHIFLSLWCKIMFTYYRFMHSPPFAGRSLITCIKKKPQTGSQICYSVILKCIHNLYSWCTICKAIGFEKKGLNHWVIFI